MHASKASPAGCALWHPAAAPPRTQCGAGSCPAAALATEADAGAAAACCAGIGCCTVAALAAVGALGLVVWLLPWSVSPAPPAAAPTCSRPAVPDNCRRASAALMAAMAPEISSGASSRPSWSPVPARPGSLDVLCRVPALPWTGPPAPGMLIWEPPGCTAAAAPSCSSPADSDDARHASAARIAAMAPDTSSGANPGPSWSPLLPRGLGVLCKLPALPCTRPPAPGMLISEPPGCTAGSMETVGGEAPGRASRPATPQFDRDREGRPTDAAAALATPAACCCMS